MSQEEIFAKVKKIIFDELMVPTKKITMEATFVDDLSVDSLEMVEIIMQIENDFTIFIPDRKVAKFVTVGDVVKYIQENKE